MTRLIFTCLTCIRRNNLFFSGSNVYAAGQAVFLRWHRIVKSSNFEWETHSCVTKGRQAGHGIGCVGSRLIPFGKDGLGRLVPAGVGRASPVPFRVGAFPAVSNVIRDGPIIHVFRLGSMTACRRGESPASASAIPRASAAGSRLAKWHRARPCASRLALSEKRKASPRAGFRESPGAGGGGRTLTTLRSRDFESRASASSTTPARRKRGRNRPIFWHTRPAETKRFFPAEAGLKHVCRRSRRNTVNVSAG